ncbi:Conserved_hypothetical protein [Hexamita inflata]|uniref:Uncharacterized protein n=1 Tax=Hexamita inflata TaxID=28002 RepID=A0AA86RHJ9_9EUKA|nr:Conserved hypothetical protein [Hexamita inflata]CAI9942111.1 Conserved hypothetical protein [Hexamita inflata]CAI9974466.1 Conserved hypothetical protein [Hexamita inflata]
MSKCNCYVIPNIMSRLTELEQKQKQTNKPNNEKLIKELDQREQALNERLERNNQKTQQLNELASKLVEEMKLLDEVKAPESNAQLEEQQKTIQNMDKLFKTTTNFFAQMYNGVKPYYNLPELTDVDKPTAILSGLEHIIRGVGEMAAQLSGQE